MEIIRKSFESLEILWKSLEILGNPKDILFGGGHGWGADEHRAPRERSRGGGPCRDPGREAEEVPIKP